MKGPVAGLRAHVAVFVGALAIGGALFLLFLHQSGAGPSLSGSYRVQAVVPTAVALAPHADVRMAGMRVGRLERIGERGGRAVLLLAIDDAYAPLRRDARVSVRLRTLVGENYLEVSPGSERAGPLPSGGVIRQAEEDEAVQLDEIFSTLDPPTRRRLQRMLAGLGDGLEDRGEQLNALVGGLSGSVEQGAPVVEILARERESLAVLVDDLGHVMRSLESRGSDLRLLARQGRRAAGAVAVRDRDLRETLERLPAALRQVRGTTTTLREVTATSAPALEDLARAVEDLGPVVDGLPRAAAAGRSAIAELDRFAPRGIDLLGDLEELAPSARDALPKVNGLLQEANPLIAYLSSYSREIGAFFASTGSAVNYYDATGATARIQSIVSESSLAAFTPETAAMVDALFESGALARLHTRANNAYPAPGEIEKPEPFEGDYRRLLPEP